MRPLSFVLFFVLIVGCGSKPSGGPAPVALTQSTLQGGTEVPLVLLRQISAGTTREGELVPFMVGEDVRDAQGNVVIERGAIAEGEVSWSRSEGTLSALANQPARLAVNIKRVRSVGGETVELVGDREKPEEGYHFTRENTGLPEARVSAEAISPEVVAKLETAIEEFFETGSVDKLKLEDDAEQWLRDLTKANDMEALEKSLDSGGSDLEKVIKHVRDGGITKLAAAEISLALTAATELSRLAHSIESGLSRKLKGRTIRAYVGTEAKAWVAKDTLVKARPL